MAQTFQFANKLLLLAAAFVCLFPPLHARAEQNLVLLGTGNLTRSSIGTFIRGAKIRQYSADKAGVGIGYECFCFEDKNVAIEFFFSYTPTNSKLSSVDGKTVLDIWPINRYEEGILLKYRWRRGKRISPYFGGGILTTVLYGGNASDHQPGGWSGFDWQNGYELDSGIDFRLQKNLALRVGALTDVIQASTFSDQTYASSNTLMVEPQVGFVYEF